MKNEKKIVRALSEHFRSKGFLVLEGVRIPPREIDLVLLDPDSLSIISIEAKTRDWRKVIAQSIVNKLYSHYSIVAMPEGYEKKIPKDVIEKYGLGLITVTEAKGGLNILLREVPTPSKKINRVFKRQIYRTFQLAFF